VYFFCVDFFGIVYAKKKKSKKFILFLKILPDALCTDRENQEGFESTDDDYSDTSFSSSFIILSISSVNFPF